VVTAAQQGGTLGLRVISLMLAMTHHLVHFNLAIARKALDHPSMAEFVGQLAPMNQLARASRGFVWAPEGDEAGNGTAVFKDERALPNLSMWQSLEDLRRFVYEGLHGKALDRRGEWFEAPRGPAYVLWWIRAGDRPDLNEAKHRLKHLTVHGPTPHAFTFTEAFNAPEDGASRPLPPDTRTSVPNDEV
jgi:Domain of unknown function (DUF3291)